MSVRIVVVLPGGEAWEALYAGAFVPWAAEKGFVLVRTQIESTLFWKPLVEELKSAQEAIVDITANNPLGMFASGCAAALGKRVTLVATYQEGLALGQKGSDLIIHSGSPGTLLKRLRELNCGETQPEQTGPAGEFQHLFEEILRRHGFRHQGNVRWEGPKILVLEEQDLPLALVQDLARAAKPLGIRLKLL